MSEHVTPSFVPFESLSDAEQREHLRRMHGCRPNSSAMAAPRAMHRLDHGDALAGLPAAVTPHTHDKPAPRPEENR